MTLVCTNGGNQVIDFLCPNGHRIHCHEDQAGRAAKCPRCGVKFRVPSASEADIAVPSGSDPGTSSLGLTDSSISKVPQDVPPGLSGEEPQIEFLCPNGHRLHGTASLQGQPGECPECGSRFHIPTYDDVTAEGDVTEEEATEPDTGVGRTDVGGESSIALPLVDETGRRREFSREEEKRDIEILSRGHPLAGLFCRLWAERPPEAPVELHLVGGETLLPDRFAPALSQESHGIFAVGEPDGTYTLNVVAWDSVVRVLVRCVAELPEEMSD